MIRMRSSLALFFFFLMVVAAERARVLADPSGKNTSADVPGFAGNQTSARPEVTQHDIVPILLLRCTVCHSARKQEGELDLRSRALMVRGGKSGPALVPGRRRLKVIIRLSGLCESIYVCGNAFHGDE